MACGYDRPGSDWVAVNELTLSYPLYYGNCLSSWPQALNPGDVPHRRYQPEASLLGHPNSQAPPGIG